MKEKSELNTLKVKRKIINCLEEKGYAAVDCDNQIDMVNREKVEDFCKTAEKEASLLPFHYDEHHLPQIRTNQHQ